MPAGLGLTALPPKSALPSSPSSFQEAMNCLQALSQVLRPTSSPLLLVLVGQGIQPQGPPRDLEENSHTGRAQGTVACHTSGPFSQFASSLRWASQLPEGVLQSSVHHPQDLPKETGPHVGAEGRTQESHKLPPESWHSTSWLCGHEQVATLSGPEFPHL